jgi:hypothetical protein
LDGAPNSRLPQLRSSPETPGCIFHADRHRARVRVNGEVSWHVRDAPAVLNTFAESGRVVLGLDMRDVGDDDTFLQIAWSVYDGEDPVEARDAALGALAREELPGDWAPVT